MDYQKYVWGVLLFAGFLQGAVDTYEIRSDYTAHTNPRMVKFFDDHADHFGGPNVNSCPMYEYASKLAKTKKYGRILDVGCGTGRRIAKYFSDCITIGYDVERIVEYANQYYPTRIWRVCDDFATPPIEEFDLVVCINLIHHLPDPNKLMHWLAAVKCKKIIISTCDREVFERQRMRIDLGPPMSQYNFREWSFSELENYVKRWFVVEEHFYSKPNFNQVIVCKNEVQI